MKLTSEIIKLWFLEWEESTQMVAYPKNARTALRDAGYDIVRLEEEIANAMSIPPKKRTELQNELLHTHKLIRKECEMQISEEYCSSYQGQIFEAKSMHGRVERQIIKLEEELSLSDVIAKNSEHNKDK